MGGVLRRFALWALMGRDTDGSGGIPLKDSKRRGMKGLGIANDFVLFKG